MPCVLWTALVAVLLLAPGGLAGSAPAWAQWWAAHHGDKVVHLVLFFGQAYWLSRLLAHARPGGAAWFAAGLAALYGLVLECAQLAVPGRGFEPADLVANAVGALLWPVVGRCLRRG